MRNEFFVKILSSQSNIWLTWSAKKTNKNKNKNNLFNPLFLEMLKKDFFFDIKYSVLWIVYRGPFCLFSVSHSLFQVSAKDSELRKWKIIFKKTMNIGLWITMVPKVLWDLKNFGYFNYLVYHFLWCKSKELFE